MWYCLCTKQKDGPDTRIVRIYIILFTFNRGQNIYRRRTFLYTHDVSRKWRHHRLADFCKLHMNMFYTDESCILGTHTRTLDAISLDSFKICIHGSSIRVIDCFYLDISCLKNYIEIYFHIILYVWYLFYFIEGIIHCISGSYVNSLYTVRLS